MFACSSSFEAIAIEVSTGRIRWRRFLDPKNRSFMFIDKCRIGFCAGVALFHQQDSSTKARQSKACQLVVFAVSPENWLLALDANTGQDCQEAVQIFSYTSVSEDSEFYANAETTGNVFGMTIPPLLVKANQLVFAMDTVRAGL